MVLLFRRLLHVLSLGKQNKKKIDHEEKKKKIKILLTVLTY